MTLTGRKLIGEILCENAFISRSQLEEAIEEQKNCKNRPLGKILMDFDYITAEQLSDALSIQKKYPMFVSD